MNQNFLVSAMLLIVVAMIFQMSGLASVGDILSSPMRQIGRGVQPIIKTAEASQRIASRHVVRPSLLVATHNKWRERVGVPPLGWSSALAKDAQAWAEVLSKKHCKMRHSKQRQHGENIFWASAKRWSDGRREVQNISGEFVVNDWGSEVRDYNYKKNKCRRRRQCGHYTQVVSRRTQKVGCGMAICTDKGQVWVCRYDPPGNIVGQRPY